MDFKALTPNRAIDRGALNHGSINVTEQALTTAPKQGVPSLGRRGFLKALGVGVVVGSGVLGAEDVGAVERGRIHEASETSIDRVLVAKEEKEHMIFKSLKDLEKPYLKYDFKYYKPKMVGDKSPWWREAVSKGAKLTTYDGLDYPLMQGQSISSSKFDVAVDAEGSAGMLNSGRERTRVIAVIKSGTLLIVDANGKPVAIAACVNPIYEWKVLCTQDVNMKDGSKKKFLYSKISADRFSFSDGDRDYTQAEMEIETGTRIIPK